MRRAFEHPLAPALGCALVCVVYLLAQPATADMAAHSYRAWLFQHEGLTVWNAQWYGGHHVLGYSLLFAPLAAAIGPAIVGVLSAIAAVALFVPLARAAAPSPDGGRRGVVAVHRGRALQRRDRADAVPARDRARGRRVVGRRARERRVLSGVLALCAMLASPVAGVFLMLGAAAKLIADGRPALRTARLARRCRRSRAGSGSTCCSPRAGPTASRRPRSGRCS